MSEKKHIDRLFQEKLKDLEVYPDPSAWNAIEERLTKKKKRRIVPLLLRLGSAAAILLLLISTGFWYFNQEKTLQTPTNTSPAVTDTDQENENKLLEKTKESNDNNATQEVEVARSQDNANSKSPLNLKKSTQEANQSLTYNRTTEPVVDRSQQEAQKIEKDNQIITQQTIEEANSKNAIAEHKELPIEQENPQKKDFQITKEDIAEAIENDLRDKEEIDEASSKKWSVGTTVAPVYFNSLGNGSPINASLAANDKVTEGTISYGIKVNYKLNKKLSIQTGINSVDLAYKTRGVTALVSSDELLLSTTNIDTNINGINLITISNNEIAAQSSELNSQRGILNLRGDLNQSFSYIEVPVEAKYALVDKKIGVHVVGGVSTYVLYNNKVSLLDQNGSTTLGEATNVNDINFSGNFGIDLDYKLNKKLFINVSPMFKYQINTFSKNDGGFKPYYLGIYTGLNFRF